jgi:acyl-homoserine-lactone acylase
MSTARLVRALIPILFCAGHPATAHAADGGAAAAAERARWESQAARVTITRDDWGIAHVKGQTDPEAVFGMIYAQAEDDFNRIETNYLVSLGRLAEAEGEKALWQDLRQRLFVDPKEASAETSSGCRSHSCRRSTSNGLFRSLPPSRD